MRFRATWRVLALGALLCARAEAAQETPPHALVWFDGSFGGGTTVQGQGLTGGGALTAGRTSVPDFLRVKWSNFGEKRERHRHPHADWMQTWSLLYGHQRRQGYLLMSGAAGLGNTTGFARGRLLYEEPGVYRWYRPRHFHAVGIVGEAFAGGATRHFAAGLTVSVDANPIRQSAAAQLTLSFGALP